MFIALGLNSASVFIFTPPHVPATRVGMWIKCLEPWGIIVLVIPLKPFFFLAFDLLTIAGRRQLELLFTLNFHLLPLNLDLSFLAHVFTFWNEKKTSHVS